MTDDQADAQGQGDAVAARIAAQTRALGSIFARTPSTPAPARAVSIPLAAVVEAPAADGTGDRMAGLDAETVSDDALPPVAVPPASDPPIDTTPDMPLGATLDSAPVDTLAEMPRDPVERWEAVPWTGMLPALNFPANREIDND